MLLLSNHKTIKYFLSFLIILFFTNAYADINIHKINSTNYSKIVTMQPIADDVDTLDFLDSGSPVALDKSEETVAGDVSSAGTYPESELKCLTQSIYFEARGEGYKGGVAVGNVIMNRVKSDKFPNTICGVMKQKTGRMCQFSFMCNGQIHQSVNAAQWANSRKIALDVLNGTAPKLSKGALFFHAKYLKLRMASNRYTAKIGQHYFYK